MNGDTRYEKWLANLEPEIRQRVEQELTMEGKPAVWFGAVDAVNGLLVQDKMERIIKAFGVPAHLVKPQEAPDET